MQAISGSMQQRFLGTDAATLTVIDVDAHFEPGDEWHAQGDLRFTVRAQGGTFQCSSTVWCDERSLIRFCRDLSAMNRTLAGEATLTSMSPDELALKISDIDGQGHFRFTASIGKHGYDFPHMNWNALQVQFVFDQTLLQTAMNLSWVRAYVAQECR